MKMKRILSLLLVLICLFSFLPTANAKTVPKSVIELSEFWINSTYDDSVSVNEIIEMVDGDGKTTGYCVSFKQNNIAKGYIVIDISQEAEKSIVEFSLEGENIYNILLNNAKKSKSGKKIETFNKKIFNPQPFEYGIEVKVDNTSMAYSSLGQFDNISNYKKKIKNITKNFNKLKLSFYDDSPNIYEGITEWPTEGTFLDIKSLPGLSYFEPVVTSDYPQDNNCGPTALTNIIKYYHDCRGYTDIYRADNLRWSYDRLVAWMEVGGYFDEESGSDPDGYPYALSNYLDEEGYDITYDEYWFNWFSDYERDINAGYPILTSISGYDDNNQRVGHAVVTIGYMIREINGSDVEYLRVLDGWEVSIRRFMRFDYYDSLKGRCVKIYS